MAASRCAHVAAITSMFFLIWMSPRAVAEVTFSIELDDPTHQLAGIEPQLLGHLEAAAGAWAEGLVGNANLTVRVQPSDEVATCAGYSFIATYVLSDRPGISYYEQGAARHLRTGQPASIDGPDIELRFNPAYALKQLWFDPDPASRVAPVGPDRVDALSVCLVALGSALITVHPLTGFDLSLPSYHPLISTMFAYDGEWWFCGPTVMARNGGPLRVYSSNPPAAGGALLQSIDLRPATRVWIAPVDWAILADAGIKTPRARECNADFNGDSTVDLDDLADFVTCYFGGNLEQDCGADSDQDGSITPDDLSDFIAKVLVGGC